MNYANTGGWLFDTPLDSFVDASLGYVSMTSFRQ